MNRTLHSLFHFLLLLSLALGLTCSAQVKLDIHRADDTTRDEWGLTEYDWISHDGRGLRKLAGLPGSIAHVKEGAERGDPKALSLLSSCNAIGLAVPQNPARAVQLARQAAATGSPVGHVTLSLDYLLGTGAPVDNAGYIAEAKAAANAGSLVAAYNLGMDYLNGKLVPQSIPLMQKYMGMAARGGFPMGESAYGSSLYLNNDVANGLEAEAWIAQGAADGDPLGSYWLKQINLQKEVGKEMGHLFVASIGGRLLGWHTMDHPVIVANPCQMEVLANDNGAIRIFTISWAQSVVEFRPPDTIHVRGVTGFGNAKEATSGFEHLYMGLHQNQQTAEEQFRVRMLAGDMDELSRACHAPSPQAAD